jgi:hypothetical protein
LPEELSEHRLLVAVVVGMLLPNKGIRSDCVEYREVLNSQRAEVEKFAVEMGL